MAEYRNNDDFKYIIQDINTIYIGKELSYAEMLDRADVPFKLKAIISAYFAKETDLNRKLIEHLLDVSKEEFSYRIFEQLKLTVRVFYLVKKNGFGGRQKEKWVHKAYSFSEFYVGQREAVKAKTVQVEDIAISKLALMMISI
ncbi:MAG: hypothetical protein HFJ08_03325 [Lachnospiraceae bacterium]|jgi:hypothetical protein|nr:hypothetical protein [Lachnospiraceae bacterium]MCX4375224.1 hypothetical protein [Lachnospiraceae bacterium]